MRSETASTATLVRSQILVVIASGFALVWLVATAPPVYVIGTAAILVLSLIFIQRPDVGLMLLLVARASSDASLGTFASALVVQQQRITTLLSPNTALILILIMGGGLFLISRGLPFLSLPAGQVYTVLLLIGLVGIMRSDDLFFSLNEWLPALSALIVYALVANLFRTSSRIQRAIDVLAASFVLPAMFGFYQLATDQGRFLSIGVRRIHGTFVHPNPYAFYLIIIFSVFLCQAYAQRGARKWLSLLIVAASSVLLVGTYSRSAWIGALVVLAVVAVLQYRRLLFLAPLIVVVVLRGIPSVIARLEGPLVSTGSFAHRRGIWETLLNQWIVVTRQSEAPFTIALDRLAGLGPGGFVPLVSPFARVLPHNDYLRILAEFGILGLVLFVLLYVLMVRMAYRVWRRSSGPTSAVALGFLAVSLAYPVLSATDNLFAMTVNQLYFWALAGLVAAIGAMGDQRGTLPASPHVHAPTHLAQSW